MKFSGWNLKPSLLVAPASLLDDGDDDDDDDVDECDDNEYDEDDNNGCLDGDDSH